MTATAALRRNVFFRTVAKLSRQYLKWYNNASYKPEKNGERWVLEQLRGMGVRTVVDVGANVGRWAKLAAATLPEATVFALEIVPATYERLQAETAEEPRIRCFNLGLADEVGRMTIHYRPDASAHATFTAYPHVGAAQELECEVVTGDAFLRAQALERVDLLKLDVEGAEHLVLAGCRTALAGGRIRLVQFEYGRVNILTRYLLKDFYDLFRGYGYVVGKIFPDFVDFREYHLDDEDFIGPNYLACPKNDPLLARLAMRTR